MNQDNQNNNVNSNINEQGTNNATNTNAIQPAISSAPNLNAPAQETNNAVSASVMPQGINNVTNFGTNQQIINNPGNMGIDSLNNEITPQMQPAGIENSNIQNKPKNSKLFLIIGGLVFFIVIAIILYFIFFNKTGNKYSPTEIAKQYVNNIISNNYSDNFSLIYLPKNNFVEYNDYLEYIQKIEQYKDINDLKIASVDELLLSEKNARYKVSLKKEKEIIKSVTVDLENIENKWYVSEDNLYLKDWSLIIPKNTSIEINGVKVSDELIKEDSSIGENSVKYVIPAICSVKKEFTLNNPLQNKTVEITPLNSNTNEKILLELNNTELIKKAKDFIKNTWNSLYQSYLNKENISDIAEKYFDNHLTIDDVDTYYQKGFDELTKGSSGYKNENFKLIDVVDGSDSCYVIAEDIITINFGYKLTYNWSFSMGNSTRTVKRYSKIRLRVIDDSFKIYEMPDNELFSYNNYMTNDF